MEFLKVWTSFREVIKPLTDSDKGRLFDAMLLYAETGEEPKAFTGNEKFLWPVAKQGIDRAVTKNETLKANGIKGGRPKTKENQQEPNETKAEPNKSLYKDKDKDNDKDIKETPLKGSKEKAFRFFPPSVEEVRDYCQERGNGVDPEQFVAFYASKGWKVGSSPMRDWKQSVITWERRNGNKARERPVKTVVAQQYEQRDYSGVQEALMEEQDREMEEFMRQQAETEAFLRDEQIREQEGTG